MRPQNEQFKGEFRHEPLNLQQDQIRLLKLSTRDAGPIRLKLYHVDLDTAPKYSALSYTWGPPTETPSHILVNNKYHPIRANLYYLLQHLWTDVDNCEEITLWIDQICIDQSTVAEKNHQVAQMSRIFRQAERVLVWLGSGTSRSDWLMDGLNALPAILPPFGRHDGEWYELISSNPYWSRLWIIQEVVLARKLMVMWGDRKLDWDVLMKFLVRVRRNHSGWQLTNLNNVRTARGMRRVDGTYQLSWEMALRLSEGSQCQEIRDKIYGLLGLVDPSLRVQPDYTKDPGQIVSEIIKQQAKAFCNETNFLPERDLFAIWDLCSEPFGLLSEPPGSEVREWEKTIALQRYYSMPYGEPPTFDDESSNEVAKNGTNMEGEGEERSQGAHNFAPAPFTVNNTIGGSIAWRSGF